VLLPLASLTETDLNAARDTAVLAFSGKAEPLSTGNSWAPSPTLRQLALGPAPVGFLLKPLAAGPHALFTQHHPDEFAATFTLGGKSLAPLWSHNFKPNHTHDETVSSVGVTFTGDLDGQRLNAWLGELLKTKGADIYRSKGVLSVSGSVQRLVFQGVHMLFDARFDRPWGQEPRTSTFVFIGRDLDRAALVAGFQNCLAR
jgi:G3E family GTPase